MTSQIIRFFLFYFRFFLSLLLLFLFVHIGHCSLLHSLLPPFIFLSFRNSSFFFFFPFLGRCLTCTPCNSFFAFFISRSQYKPLVLVIIKRQMNGIVN